MAGLSVRRSQFACASWEVSQRPPTDRLWLDRPEARTVFGFCERPRSAVLEAAFCKPHHPGHKEVSRAGALACPRLPFAVPMRPINWPISFAPAHGMDSPPPIHISVMLDEVLAALEPRAGQVIVDGTLGAGGHTRALAERVGPSGYVLALDRDSGALEAAERNLAGLAVKIAAANYCELGEVLKQLEIQTVDGILLDVGLSSDQLADATRGFSFDAEGDLDLRFDNESGEPAWRLIQRLDAVELANLIFELGEERHSRRIARAIVERRINTPIRTAKELAELVRANVPRSPDTRRIDPATRTFQALRIAVNDELGSLTRAMRDFPNYLAPGGRLAVISFHSLEDRIVKEAFRDDPRWEVITRKPLRASDTEVNRNPRARSAKLRVARRTV